MDTPIEALPEELVARILAAVPCIVRARDCARVCSLWHRLAGDRAAMGGAPCVAAGWHSRHAKEVGVEHHPMSLVDHAAAAGHVHCLDYAESLQPGPALSVACLLAAYYGRSEALSWLAARDVCSIRTVYTRLSEMAIRGGDLDCLDIALSLGVAFDRERACAMAAAASHAVMLAHLRTKGCAWTDDVCRQSADSGSVECLAYAHRSGLSLDTCGVHHAIRWHRNDIARYLWTHKHPPTRRCMDMAGRFGNVECFAHAHKSGIDLDACDWTGVVQRDNVEIVRYACAHGWTPPTALVTSAVRAGCMAMVQCLVDRGCRPDADAMAAAAKSRSMPMVQYLIGIRCPWDERVCAMAVRAVDAAMLRCAHSHGCPWNRAECQSILSRVPSRERGRRAVARYLDAHAACVGGRCIK